MEQLTFEKARKVKNNGAFDDESRLFRIYWTHITILITCVYPFESGYFEIINGKIEHFLE